jgi:hypothetical protein
MTYTDVIARADELRVNTVSDEQKHKWVYELECRIAEMMGKNDPEWIFPNGEAELLLPPRHDDVYVKYLVAMIDFASVENEQYANDTVVFEDAFNEARSWWIRNNRPASSGAWKV